MHRHHILLIVLSEALPVFLIAAFFRIESKLRMGEAAKSLSAQKEDRTSTRYLGIVIGLSLLSILVSPLLNFFRIAFADKISFLVGGTCTMLAGLAFRITAALSLGKFYTRTLKRLPDHRLLTAGIYRFIRNPGYLGDLLLFGGAGLASNNYISLGICVLLPLIAFLYRIHAEESMLEHHFGDEFRKYRKKSWRLIPFIY